MNLSDKLIIGLLVYCKALGTIAAGVALGAAVALTIMIILKQGYGISSKRLVKRFMGGVHKYEI